MATLKKIGTCSYCQTRVVISVTAGSRHALACTACGAPLDQTEIVAHHTTQSEEPVNPPEAARRERQHEWERQRERDRDRRDKRSDRKKGDRRSRSSEPDRKSKRKPNKSGLRHWFKKLIDEIEDLFD